MKSETDYEAFTRTGSTWLSLAAVGVLWLAVCAWALTASGFSTGEAEPDTVQVVQAGNSDALDVIGHDDAVTPVIAPDSVALLEEEQARLRLKEAAAEQARLEAEAQAAEQARLEAEAQAAEQARLEAEAQAAEQARLEAEAQAAEQARLEAEAQAAEQARLEAEAQAAEQARLEAEAQAAEQARLTAETEKAETEKVDNAEKARVEAEEAAEEKARQEEEARQAAQLALRDTEIDDSARRAAAAEASRVAALARQQRQYERRRDQELRILAGQSLRIRFAPNTTEINQKIRRSLDSMFDPLYLYSEVPVVVSVATNEFEGAASDSVLSRDRGHAIIAYLVSRGLDENRFRIQVESGDGLPFGTHRVRVSAEETSQ